MSNPTPTTPEPVSPAPDTEALRQQVAKRIEQALIGAEMWEPGDTTIRTACECGERSGELTPTNHATCMDWWRAHVLRATPTTDPAPAAAPRVCDCATCWPGSSFMHLCAQCGNKRCPGAANHANECTGSNATGQPGSLYEHANSPNPTRCAGCNAADEFWCSCPDGYEPPAAPQAPAEPTGCPDCHEAAPAAREDTAPPAWTEHDIEATHQDDGWVTAECRTCGASIGESTEDTVEDWADAHRADTLRPSAPTEKV